MNLSILALFLSAMIACGNLSAQSTLWDDTCDEYSHQVYNMSEPGFAISNVSHILTTVSKKLGQRPLIYLEFYRKGPNEGQLRRLGAPGASEVGFAPTNKFLYPLVRIAKLYVAYAVQMGSEQQTIAIRRGDVETVKRIVKGHDAMHLEASGQTLEIVHIGFRLKAKYEFKEGRCKGTPQIFASTEGQPSSELELAAFQELEHRLPIDFVLFIRNDSWFWDWDTFPVLDPFHALSGDPTNFDKKATLVCSKHKSTPVCTVLPPRIPYLMEPPKIP